MRRQHTRRRFVATALGAAGLSSGITSAVTAQREDTELGRGEAIQAGFDAGEKVRDALGIDGIAGVTVGAEPNADGEMAIVLNGFHSESEAEQWRTSDQGNGRGRPNGGGRGAGNESGGDGSGPPAWSRGRRRSELQSAFPVGRIPDSVEVSVGSNPSRRRTTTFPVEVRHRVVLPEDHPGNSPHEAETYADADSEGWHDTEGHRPPITGNRILVGGREYCSLGAPAEGEHGTRYAATAGHCGYVEEGVVEPDYPYDMGIITKKRFAGAGKFDGALIALFDDVSYPGDLTFGGTRYAQFQGSRTMGDLFWELYDYNISNTYLEYGAKTGAHAGGLGGIVSWDQYTFWVGHEAETGDSGAATWTLYDNLAAGTLGSKITCPGGCSENRAIYTCYEGFEDEFGVTVAP